MKFLGSWVKCKAKFYAVKVPQSNYLSTVILIFTMSGDVLFFKGIFCHVWKFLQSICDCLVYEAFWGRFMRFFRVNIVGSILGCAKKCLFQGLAQPEGPPQTECWYFPVLPDLIQGTNIIIFLKIMKPVPSLGMDDTGWYKPYSTYFGINSPW